MIPASIMKVKKAMDEGGEVEIWGDGQARREFLYISDLVEFVKYAVDNIESLPGRVNVGLGTDYSIQEYYEAIFDVIGYTGGCYYNLDKPVGMKRKLLNISVAKSLGWSPKMSLTEGIRRTYNYAVNNEGI
jgi:GDP-L-fucose synthase